MFTLGRLKVFREFEIAGNYVLDAPTGTFVPLFVVLKRKK